MLSLDSGRWAELNHAYGAASDMPALLKQLEKLPPSNGREDPWFAIWSALAHQGDVYSASFAAVPHVINALASNPSKADASYFQFPVWVEICRAKRDMKIPDDLSGEYFEALARLPGLVAAVSGKSTDSGFLACLLAAIAVANGQPNMAEAALELRPDIANEFIEWLADR